MQTSLIQFQDNTSYRNHETSPLKHPGSYPLIPSPGFHKKGINDISTINLGGTRKLIDSATNTMQ